jgi:hypothetical protein
MRSYLDESGLRIANAPLDQVRDAINDLVDVMDEIRAHAGEELLLWSESAYDEALEEGRTLENFLFQPRPDEAPLVDVKRRWSIALDRLPSWENVEWELEVTDYDVRLGSETVLAPSLAQAVAADASHGPIACLALSTAREAGTFEATMGASCATLHAITSLDERPRFVRNWLLRNPPPPAELARFTERAFPELSWTDEARSGLRTNSKYFFNDRFETTIRHLGVLNDHAAEIFSRETEPDRREQYLAAHDVNANSESPNTRADKRARAERLVHWRGEDLYFWWHTKIRFDTGRIHFHHDSAAPAPGRIVVGLCVKHLKV